MKLGKEEIQKIVLGGMLFAALIYGYSTFLLNPLQRQRAATRKSIDEMTPRIEAAKEQIKRSQTIEQTATAAGVIIAQVDAMIPEGSPVAWFPPRVAEFFKARTIDKAATRMNNEFPEKDLPGFRRLSWGIELPKADFVPLARALADLENEEPLIEILSLQIDSSREDNEMQRVLLTVSNIVKQ
jgi:hypothetical protein